MFPRGAMSADRTAYNIRVTRKLVLALTLILATAVTALYGQAQRTTGPSVDVFKSATCGCCAKWVDHMRNAGFTVHVTDLDEAGLQKIKTRYGVPGSAQSCHTARVEGFTIEGHVPATEVKRLLKEKPAVVGLAVPGMPLGSPGMEVSGVKPQPYNVLTFDKNGRTKVYSVQKPE
jgi:hypothetical protein